MDTLLESVDPQMVLAIAAIAIALLLFRLLLRVLNVGTGTILTIVTIGLVLQYFFGISPKQLLFEISHLPQDLMRLVKSLG